MYKSNRRILYILPILFLILAGCIDKKKPSATYYNMEQLVRVDVQSINENGSYGKDLPIPDKDKVNVLGKLFEQISWKQNVKAEMTRHEDVKLILFLNIEKNMPERLVEYLIWFNDLGTAEIIVLDEHVFGFSDQKSTEALKELITQTNPATKENKGASAVSS